MSAAPPGPPPLCSVVIPCFNAGGVVQEAVASVQASRHPAVETVIVDDGSTDPETRHALDACAALARVRVIHQARQGPAAARNAAIRQAAGAYILPLDADDRIHPDFIGRAVAALEAHPRAGLVSCAVEFFGTETGRCFLPPYRFPGILLRNSFVCSCVFRRADWQAVGGYNSNLVHGGEDWDFWISLLALGRDVIQLPDVLFYYRRQGPSRTTGSLQRENLRRTHQTLRANHAALFRRYRWALLADRARWFWLRHTRPPERWS